MMQRLATLLTTATLSMGLSHCAGEDARPSTTSGGAVGAGGAPGNGGHPTVGGDAGAAVTSPADEIPSFNGCDEAAYEDRSANDAERIIEIAAAGLTFTPKCLTIERGQEVTWSGSLSAHPLAPGNPNDEHAGSPNTPITATGSGSSVRFTFDTAGTFPYYCELHAFGDGRGMAGVIHVKP